MSNKETIAPAQEKKPVRATKEKKVEETKIYIGPTIPGIVKGNMIFKNGIPAALEKKAKELPAIGSLIIPISELARANAELRKSDSALETIFKKVENSL